MSNEVIQVDDSQVLLLFERLSQNKMKAAYKKTLGKSAMILVKQARVNLKKVTSRYNSNATNKAHGWNYKVSKAGKVNFSTLQQGIRYKVSKNGMAAKVNIMADFRLKWFEMGTDERSLKGMKRHGAFRGSMKATHFFTDAKKETETQIFAMMDETLRQSILKVATNSKR
jgi:hypothetical protein